MTTVISEGYMIYRPEMQMKYHGPQWQSCSVYKSKGTAERYAHGGKVVPVQIVIKEEDNDKCN